MAEFFVIAMFSLVMGANDGASIVAVNGPSRGIGTIGSTLVLVAGVVAAPLVVGWEVATTVAFRLVTYGAGANPLVFLVAVVVAVAVVFGLSRRGLPTSLTLALVGGVVGAGFGGGLSVQPGLVLAVLAVGVAAPLIAGLAGFLTQRALAFISIAAVRPRTVKLVHAATFTAQAAAYGANDGQKAFAVVAMLAGTSGSPGSNIVSFTWDILAGVGILFLIGAAIGLRAVRGGLGRRLVPQRTHHSMSAQLASAVSVGASSAVGAPVSMTQASAASLVGSTAAESRHRVRWDQAVRIGQAWILTLPISVVLGAGAGAVVTLNT